jgi:hypothetical protein
VRVVCWKGGAGFGVGAWVELGDEVELEMDSPAAEGIGAVMEPN